VQVGDLVTLHWGRDGNRPTSYDSPPTEWYADVVVRRRPMIFLGWCEDMPKPLSPDRRGWAELLHPDGTKKVVHSGYFIKVSQ